MKAPRVAKAALENRKFDYSLDYKNLDLREQAELYRVGIGEQGVLSVEPYKSEILPHWRFKTPDIARESAKEIYRIFEKYVADEDFVGMDMARKFLQMGYTRSRRYANHKSGTKYDLDGAALPDEVDAVKAESALVFKQYWDKVESHADYRDMKMHWRAAFG